MLARGRRLEGSLYSHALVGVARGQHDNTRTSEETDCPLLAPRDSLYSLPMPTGYRDFATALTGA
jgi:hypothetical protein